MTDTTTTTPGSTSADAARITPDPGAAFGVYRVSRAARLSAGSFDLEVAAGDYTPVDADEAFVLAVAAANGSGLVTVAESPEPAAVGHPAAIAPPPPVSPLFPEPPVAAAAKED